MTYIPKKLRQQVIDRANERCEYCQTSLELTPVLEVDHIVPIAAGGKTEIGNLCAACDSCNNRKKTFQTGIDPETNEEFPIYNPRLQDWHEHFSWSDDGVFLVGLTPIARATIRRLKINRDAMVRVRRKWVEAGWHPPK